MTPLSKEREKFFSVVKTSTSDYNRDLKIYLTLVWRQIRETRSQSFFRLRNNPLTYGRSRTKIRILYRRVNCLSDLQSQKDTTNHEMTFKTTITNLKDFKDFTKNYKI